MKYEIARLIKEAAPGYISGEELGRHFLVTRTAVWKCIVELRREGYSIEASPRKGYRMLPSEDRLNSYEIADGLDTAVVGREVVYLKSVDSTNDYAKKLAAKGCMDGVAVIGGRQTKGRGRLGRDWESPADKGIYVSVVLRPAIAPAEAQILTLTAAVAAAKAILKSTGIRPGIKWPNDLVIDGKKVCGILLEMNSEADSINYVVLGIGINFSQNAGDFADEIKKSAISLKMAAGNPKNGNGVTTGRLSVIRSLLRELDGMAGLVYSGQYAELLDMWREYSATLGKEVRFEIKGVQYTGIACDITADGKLSVNCSDGVQRDLLSGEVSVRGMYGYI